jgi:serine/threonine protein phosphatase PrpC/cell division protein FtsN
LYHYGAGTNVGNVRDNNEDSYVCDEEKDLWIVADGMGGLGFGEVASAITTLTVTRMVREGHGINQAIEIAHQNIKKYAETDGMGTNMGTTIVLLLSHGSLYNIFWVGDSRAYLLDKEQMKQVTTDHSLVQSLIDQGELTKEQAETDPRKNAVTRALGVQELETVRADSISERWQPGQKILLCSDGLTDCVSDAKIEELMLEGGEDQEIVDRLIEAALEGGGKDNVTVIVISAPTHAKISDTDTYVPAAATRDDTDVPLSDDTYVPSPDDMQSQKREAGQQLDLRIEDAPESQAHNPKPTSLVATNSLAAKKTENDTTLVSANQPWYKISSAVAVAVLFLVIVASVGFDRPNASVPENFRSQDSSPATPIARNFPDTKFPTAGAKLQLGVFSKLQGAESRQTKLSSLGLTPHIEKRLDVTGTLYAVVLGPLDDEDHQKVLRKLKKNDMNYFHTEWQSDDYSKGSGS